MSRPTRSLRPSFDPLEAKTLLSSGAAGHAAGHHAALGARPELGANNYYIYVQTSGFTATNVTWNLMVGMQLFQSGTVKNGTLGGPPPVLVYTTKGAPNTLQGKFVFTYYNGTAKGSDTGAGHALDRVWPASLFSDPDALQSGWRRTRRFKSNTASPPRASSPRASSSRASSPRASSPRSAPPLKERTRVKERTGEGKNATQGDKNATQGDTRHRGT